MWGSGVGLDNGDPRTAVGYTATNHVIMITADGRQVASQGVGLPELAQIMIDLGCVEAMNLDGGGSTQMAVGNQLVDTPSESRAIPTILTVTHKDSLKLPSTPQYEKIIDTSDPEAIIVGGDWFTTANPGSWGGTPALLNAIGNGSSYVEFSPEIQTQAQYEVYAWWVADLTNRCSDTPFIIKHKNGVDTIRVNQKVNGVSWQLIGNFQFSADTSQKIIISDAGTTGTYVVADAIRLISYDPATPVEEERNQVPTEFLLHQNYPNPFNPVTNISFNLAKNDFVTIKIYDVLGKEVKTLISEERNAGYNNIMFNASSLSTGIYFYQFRSGVISETKSMILLK